MTGKGIMRLPNDFLREKDIGTCALCLNDDVLLTDEHIFPRSLGGKIVCQFLCRDCNKKMGKIDHEFDHGMLPRLNHIISGAKGKITPREFIGCLQGRIFDAEWDIAPPLEGGKIAYEIACCRFGLQYARGSNEARLLQSALLNHAKQDTERLVLPFMNHELPQLEESIGSRVMWATEFWGLSVVSLAGVIQGVITEKEDNRFRTPIEDANLYLVPCEKGDAAEIVSLRKWYEDHRIDARELRELLKKLCP